MVVRARSLHTQDPTSTSVNDLDALALPAELRNVADAIEDSRSLLALEDDWDGEGTSGFSEQTWRRTAEFLVRAAIQLWEDHGIAADLVEVLPGSEGALAIDWRTDRRELLVTIPADPMRSALLYGDDGKGNLKIKGTLDPSAPNRWLTQWFAE